jgi:tricorn protease
MNRFGKSARTALALLGLSLAALPTLAQQNLLELPAEKPIKGASWASISPDGKTVAFTYIGDIWTVPAEGGTASRLTVHEGVDALSRWSPDGKWIAYSSLRNGNYDVFIIPAQGGPARQVTLSSANDWICDWSPDGQKLLFYSLRDTKAFALFTIDLKTKAVKRVTEDTEALRYGAWSPDGKKIAYTRTGQPWWRPWYRGSVAAHTVVKDLETGKVKTISKSSVQEFWPLFTPDSKSVYVTLLGNGGNTPNIWRMPVDGGRAVQVTKQATDAVRWPSASRNTPMLAYTLGGDVYTTNAATGATNKLRIIARSEDKVNNQERQTLTQGAIESEPSPDGKQIAFVLRGEIWQIPVAGGDAKRLTDDPANDNDINWSPDGKKLVFVSDRGNQPDLYQMDVATKAVTRLTNDTASDSAPQYSPDGKWISFAKAGSQPGLYVIPSSGGEAKKVAAGNGSNNFGIGVVSHAWSPDSRWLAFSRMDRYQNTDLWVVPAVGGDPVNVTRYPETNANPQFSKDGRSLFFVSNRGAGGGGLFRLPLEQEDDQADDKDESGKPKPKPDRSKDVKIDFDDIHLRSKLVAGGVGDYGITPDSQRIIARIGNGFYSVPASGGQPSPIAPQEFGGNIRIAADGSKFFYMGAGGTIRSLGMMPSAPTTIAFSAVYNFDRRVVTTQAFNEFFRRFGTAFYDAKLHGVNWTKARAKYSEYLEGVGTPEEFANVLSMMVGEVNASHSEISPASRGGGPNTATLGIIFDNEYTGPGLKVAEVMPKGPADKPSTRIMKGEYILAIDGTDIKGLTEDYYTLLYDKSGKATEILVNSKPTKEGARTVKMKPIGTGEFANLEYERMVRQNRALVEKLSDGKLGYLHIRNMDQPSLARFEREMYSDILNKQGLVLDIRGNGGGNTHDAILNVLSRKVYGFTQPRDAQRMSQPERAFTKPVVLLINQNSFSDAEIFPAGFRALGIGKIVGVPTPGYVIGTYGGALVDGTQFRLPSWGWYTAEGVNMENLGIPPDYYVELTAEDVAANRDPQIEKAVQLALSEKYIGIAAPSDSNVGVPASANANANGGSSDVPAIGSKNGN